MNELIKNTEQTMSLKDITDLLETRHNDAMKVVEKMAESLEFGSVTKISYRTTQGNEYDTYALDKRQSVAVSAKLNTALLMRVIDRWQELESAQPKVPTNFIEAMQLATATLIENQALQLKIDYDKPKVEFAEKVRALDGSISVGDFAKLIGTGQNRLFKRLRDDGYLMVNNHPMQSAVERKLLVQIEQTPFTDSNGKSHPAFQTRITGTGQVYFEKRYRVAVSESVKDKKDLTILVSKTS